MDLVKRDKYNDNFLLTSDFFGDFLSGGRLFPKITETLPSINVKEDADKYLIMIAIPGIDKEDCKLIINDGVLKVYSETENEDSNLKEKGSYSHYEYNYKYFSRSLVLPKNIDTQSVSSKYKNGELIITLPKKELDILDHQEIPIE